MEDCRLSTDLVVDILSRLPIKSLMRFKCVCKFFFDLITSDHHFMRTHYGIRNVKTDCFLLEAGRAVREYYLLYKESEGNEIECIYLDIPRTPGAQWVKCCQGVLCLISTRNTYNISKLDHGGGDYLIYDIWIWNPSIRKVKALPSVTVPYRPPYDAFVHNNFGFGISNDMTWKVVMLLQFVSYDGRTTHEITLVYSQDGSDSWSLRQIDSVTSCRYISRNDFYFKGRYYWRAEMSYEEPYNEYLIWFDMNDEVCGTIELPWDVSIIFSVSVMNKTIALLGYSSVGDSRCLEIWLMIENDNNTYWRRQASIDCVVILNTVRRVVVFLDKRIGWDSEHLYPEHYSDRVVPYFISKDLVTRERKMLSISKQRKSITMASNSTAGHFQVYNERNTYIPEEWKHKFFMRTIIYARVYDESLHLP